MRHPELQDELVGESLEEVADTMRGESSAAADEVASHGALLRRAARYGLERAWADYSSGVDYLTPDPLEDTVAALRHAQRRAAGGDAAALDEAIGRLRAVIDHPAARTVLPAFVLGMMNDLGLLLNQRGDLHEAIATWRQAIGESPEGPDLMPRYANNLGGALLTLYNQSDDLADLREAVAVLRKGLAATPASAPQRPNRLFMLVSALEKVTALDAEDDGQAEFDDLLAETVQAISDPSWDLEPSQAERVANHLGSMLIRRFERSGDPAVADLAIAALRVTAAGSLVQLVNLALALRLRFEVTSDVASLAEATEILRRARALMPPGDEGQPTLLNNLAQALRHHYELGRDASDLDEAIALGEEAVRLTPPDAPALPKRLAHLAGCLSRRYDARRDRADLERAIELITAALGRERSDAPERCYWLTGLANGLIDRYELTAQPADLDSAFRFSEEAVSAAPDGWYGLEGALVSHGNAALLRYAQTGELSLVERGIESFERAFTLTRQGSTQAPVIAYGYGSALLQSQDDERDRDRLNLAIAVLTEGLAGAPRSSSVHDSLSGLLGTAVSQRYGKDGEEEDFNHASQLLTETLDRVAADTDKAAAVRFDLAGLASRRFERTGDQAQLDIAVGTYQQVLDARSPDGVTLINLGLALWSRYGETSAAADLRRGVKAFRDACQLEAASSQSRLKAARHWSAWGAERTAWAEVIEAYGYGLAAAQQLSRVQVTAGHREAWLHEGRGLIADAGCAFAALGRPTDAVLALERGRAVLLSDALQLLRADLRDLRKAGQGDLADQYVAAARRVAAVEADLRQTGPLSGQPGAAGGLADPYGAARKAQAELAAAVAEVRQFSGYEGFQADVTFADIAASARVCPLVYLVAGPRSGWALVVDSEGTVTARELAGLTTDSLNERGQSFLRAYRRRRDTPGLWRDILAETTGWLWDAAMGEVIDALAGTESAALITTGLLGLLPWHAAWTADPERRTGRHYVIDDLTISYTPNARAIGTARRLAAVTQPAGLLAVQEPTPVSAEPLAASAAEVAQVSGLFKRSRVLAGPAATASAVRAEFGHGWPVLHFSCHGYASIRRPLESALLLAYDEEITLRRIIDADLDATRLVVLSACETAMAGTDLPDEALSLAAGFLQAGAAGILGSLWAVPEVGTALLISRFYDLWLTSGLSPAQALRQAQLWLRDSTNAEKAEAYPGIYAEGTSSDLWRSARMHGDPDSWAAFVFSGA
jgi:tetratricopeptide (TPR) repeat protein